MSDICTVRKSTLDGIARQTQRLTGSTEQMKAGEIAGKLEDVPSQPTKGFVFSEYDSDGYPHKAEFVGSWSGTSFAFQDVFKKNSNCFAEKITSLTIPEGITNLPQNFLLRCHALTEINLPSTLTTITGTHNFYGVRAPITIPASVTAFVSNQQFVSYEGTTITFLGNVPNIPNFCFGGATNMLLYDFSHATAIPSLYSVNSLGHASGCVIRIPSALSDQTLGTGNGWESATNWSGLTNIVWEVV